MYSTYWQRSPVTINHALMSAEHNVMVFEKTADHPNLHSAIIINAYFMMLFMNGLDMFVYRNFMDIKYIICKLILFTVTHPCWLYTLIFDVG